MTPRIAPAPVRPTETFPLLTAVTYQRVSTKEQASKGGRDEGFSIPAQREANTRKAESIGARMGVPPVVTFWVSPLTTSVARFLE